METVFFFWINLCIIIFLSYLWGMETEKGYNSSFYFSFCFLSYVWGMETSRRLYSWGYFCNTFYPTYEEWKQDILTKKNSDYGSFLSYLWGMETLWTKKFLVKRIHLFILPMRNGNETGLQEFLGVSSLAFYPTYEEWKHVAQVFSYPVQEYFLSYLWGMEWVAKSLPFYPTYEEWKHCSYLYHLVN